MNICYTYDDNPPRKTSLVGPEQLTVVTTPDDIGTIIRQIIKIVNDSPSTTSVVGINTYIDKEESGDSQKRNIKTS